MNIVDRTIALFSPQAALQRVAARHSLHQFDLAVRGYEGASRGRRTAGWNARATSANTENGPALGLLRDRSRDSIRNHPYAHRAQEVWVGNAVGKGIVPQKLPEQEIELFKRWSDECDADGQLDFYGLQDLVAGAEYESGEVLIRTRVRRLSDGLSVPLQFQVLEADHLDTSKTEQTKTGYIIQGVEFDLLGQRVAYWLFPTHPGDSLPFARNAYVSKRVPANEVMHVFDRRRPGQVRGIPALASVLLRLRDLDEYEDAELMRKKVEACFAAFVTDNGDIGAAGNILTKTDKKDGVQTEQLAPGVIKRLGPGQDVKFGSPSAVGGHGEYHRTKTHEIAAGSRTTYQQMTGDLSQANYSSMRGGRIEFQNTLVRIQRHVLIQQFCRPAYRAFGEMAVVAGCLQTFSRPEWLPPKPPPVDPLKDAQADLMRLRAGLVSLYDAIAENGGDPDKTIEAIASVNKQLDKFDIVLDSDPRRVAKSGVMQIDQGKGEDDAENKGEK